MDLANSEFDVLVVGGGIQGAGVAQAAAAAGYSVLIIEEKEIASGTSSRSSKLIHGGLRYLETAQFSLVRECLLERRYLLKNAPDLVKLKPFYIPVYRHTTRRSWQIRIGLFLYGLLTGFDPSARFRTVPKKEWNGLDGLQTEGLQAVFQYWDAQTDDALLTKAVIQSARNLGASLLMPARFESAEPLSGEGNGVNWLVKVYHHDAKKEFVAKAIVNAAGPWVNQILSTISPAPKKMDIELVKGTHIIIEKPPTRGIYYVEAHQDRRAVFVMPWYDKTMIGTTEQVYTGDPRTVSPSEEEKAYLLDVYNQYFASDPISDKDVIDSFAGLRVLPTGAGSAFSRPRDTVLKTGGDGLPFLLTLYGGKLTSYRATAARVLGQINTRISMSGNSKNKVNTQNISLPKSSASV